MQELCEGMKLLAFDLQDSNRIIERYGGPGPQAALAWCLPCRLDATWHFLRPHGRLGLVHMQVSVLKRRRFHFQSLKYEPRTSPCVEGKVTESRMSDYVVQVLDPVS